MSEQTYRIEVQAVAVDKTQALEAAQKAVTGYEKTVEKANRTVDRLNQKRPKGIDLEADDNVTPVVQRATRGLKRLTGRRHQAHLGAVDDASHTAERVGRNLSLVMGRRYAALITLRDALSDPLGRISMKLTNLARFGISIPVKIADMATRPLRSFGRFATSLPGVAALGLGSWAGAMNPMSKASDLETTGIGYGTILKNQGKGDDFVKQMMGFAEKTPFQFNEVTGAAQRMMAFKWTGDQVDTKKILQDLTVIGDASAGLGRGSEGIDRITLALGQMRGLGRVSAEDMNQLIDVGVGAWDYLAKGMGKSIKQVRELSQKGALDADKSIKLIMAGMKADFGGGMEKISHTFNGLKSTIADVFELDIVTAWGQGLNKAVVPRLQKFADLLTKNKKFLNQMKSWVQTIAYTGAETIMRGADRMMKRMKDLVGSDRWKAASPFGKLRLAWDEIIVAPFDQWFKGGGDKIIQDRATKVGSAFGGALGGLLAGVFGIASKDIKQDLGPFAEAGAVAGRAFLKSFVQAFDKKRVSEKAKEAFKGLQPTWMGGHSEGKFGLAVLVGELAIAATMLGKFHRRGKEAYEVIQGIAKVFRKGGAKAATEAVEEVAQHVPKGAAAKAAQSAGEAAGASKAARAMEDTAKAVKAAQKAAKAAPKTVHVPAGYKAAGEDFWSKADLGKVSKRADIVEVANSGKLGRLGELEEAFEAAGKVGTKAGPMKKAMGAFGYIFDALSIATAKDKIGATAGVAGGMAGGAAGTAIGAAIGTAILPGIGTAIGGFLGSLAGSVGGDAMGKYGAKQARQAYAEYRAAKDATKFVPWDEVAAPTAAGKLGKKIGKASKTVMELPEIAGGALASMRRAGANIIEALLSGISASKYKIAAAMVAAIAATAVSVSAHKGELYGPPGPPSKTPSIASPTSVVKKHAVGGIFTQPHVGMVAEAGPEAVIPLGAGSRVRRDQLMAQVNKKIPPSKRPSAPRTKIPASTNRRMAKGGGGGGDILGGLFNQLLGGLFGGGGKGSKGGFNPMNLVKAGLSGDANGVINGVTGLIGQAFSAGTGGLGADNTTEAVTPPKAKPVAPTRPHGTGTTPPSKSGGTSKPAAQSGVSVQIASGAVQVQVTVQANQNGQLDPDQIAKMCETLADPLAEEIAKKLEAITSNMA